jgi:hypothetical protein
MIFSPKLPSGNYKACFQNLPQALAVNAGLCYLGALAQVKVPSCSSEPLTRHCAHFDILDLYQDGPCCTLHTLHWCKLGAHQLNGGGCPYGFCRKLAQTLQGNLSGLSAQQLKFMCPQACKSVSDRQPRFDQSVTLRLKSGEDHVKISIDATGSNRLLSLSLTECCQHLQAHYWTA